MVTQKHVFLREGFQKNNGGKCDHFPSWPPPSVGANAQCTTVASNAQYLCNRYAMFMQSAIILHAQHLNGEQQKCYKSATCTIIYFTMIIFACTTNCWCKTYMHNSYFCHSCTISMYILVVVHCIFNILVVHVFASYATAVHNDNKKDVTKKTPKSPK